MVCGWVSYFLGAYSFLYISHFLSFFIYLSVFWNLQDFEKGSNSGGAAVVGGRPVASGPNRFHHHFAIRAASPPPAPESEP